MRSISIYIKIVLACAIFTLTYAPLRAQNTVQMVNGDTVWVDLCSATSGVLVDDGGMGGNYSDSFDGWVVLRSVEGTQVNISGRYRTEECCDGLHITSGTRVLGDQLRGNGTFSGSATGDIVFYFHSDGSVTDSGFVASWATVDAGTGLPMASLCQYPVSNLTVTAATTGSLSLSWQCDYPGTASTVVRYRQQTEPDWQTIYIGSSQRSYTLTGLTAGTLYTVSVGQGITAAGSNMRCCYDSVMYRTACGTTEVTYTEGFEGLVEGTFPPCWLQLTNFDDDMLQPQVSATHHWRGSRSLLLSSGSTEAALHFGLVATGPLQSTSGTPVVTARLTASHEGTVIEVGLCDTGGTVYNQYGFTPFDTVTFAEASTWVTYRRQLTAAQWGSGQRRIAFRMVQQMQQSHSRIAYIDNLGVADCWVDSVRLTELSDGQYTLSWAQHGCTQARVDIMRVGGGGQHIMPGVAVSPMTVTLQAASDYYITVTPICGGDGLAGQISIHTPAAPFSGDRYCLDNSRIDDLVTYNCRVNPMNQSGLSADPMDDQRYSYIVFEPIANLVGKEVMASINGYYTDVAVGVMGTSSDTAGFTPLDSTNTDYYYHRFIHFTVPAGITAQRVAIRFRGWDFHLHNLEVGSCLVDSLRYTHRLYDGITFGWESAGANDTVVFEYGPVGFSQGTGTTATFVGQRRGTIGGLNPGSEYDFIVSRPCGGTACGTSRLRTSTNDHDFHTPYCEDFREIDWWNELCWRGIEGFNNYPRFDYEYFDYRSQRVLQMGSFGFDWGYASAVALPEIALSAGDEMSFYATSFAPDGKLVIGTYVNDGVKDETRYYGDTINLIGDGQRHHYRYTVGGRDSILDGRIALRFYHTSEYHPYRCYIDELHVAHAAYGTLTTPYVGFDTAALTIDTLYNADSALVYIVSDNDSLAAVWRSGNLGFGGLDSGTLYRCYVLPLGDTNACPSYAGYFITNAIGEGVAACYTFDELLSYELPANWIANGTTNVTADGHLQLSPATAVATRPVGPLSGFALRFAATGDTIVIGSLPDNAATGFAASAVTPLDTVVPGTTWHSYELQLPADAPAGRICFLAKGSGAMIDNVNLYGCAIVNFTINGNSIVCRSANGSAGYYLFVSDSLDTDIRQEYVEQNPFIVQNLLLGTTYQVSYSCVGSGDEDCRPLTTIHTGNVAPLPYCEQFESSEHAIQLPQAWSVHGGPDGHNYSLDTWGPSIAFWSGGDRWSYITLPLFEHSSALTMNIKTYTWDDSVMQVGYLAVGTDTASFVPLHTFRNDWQEKYIDLTPAIDKHIAFRTKRDCRIFRITLDSIPLITYSVPDATTILVRRSEPGSYYLHYRDVNGYNIDTTMLVNADTVGITLSEGANDIYLSTSSDSLFSFCNYETYIQMSEHVDLPHCIDYWWDWYFKRLSSLSWHYPGDEWIDDNHVFYFNVNNLNQLSEWLILPDYNVDSVKDISVDFIWRSPYAGDVLELGVMSDMLDTASFTPVATLTNAAGVDQWRHYNASLSSYSGSGRFIAMRHRNGRCAGCPEGLHMYIDSMMVYSCPAAAGATVSLERWNTVRIDSPDTSGTVFYAEYGPQGFWQGSGTVVRIDQNPQRIVLPGEARYDFYLRCDSLGYSCMPPQQVSTLGLPLELPACINFDSCAATTVPSSWTSYISIIGVDTTVSHTADNSMMVPSGLRSYLVTPDINTDDLRNVALSVWYMVESETDRLVVGTMGDPSNLGTFYPVRSLAASAPMTWQHALIDLSNIPEGNHFIAFRARSGRTGSTGNIYIDDIFLDTCAAFDLRVSTLTDNSITFSWSQSGHPDISIAVEQDGLPVGTYSTANAAIDPDSATLTIDNLQSLSSYTFYFSSSCGMPGSGYCNMTHRDTTGIIMPAPGAGCINPTDLSSPQAVFYSGTYSHPYAVAGAVNYGALNAESRHTVCYDTSYRDPRTGGLLRTIPEGYTSSLRLGNWSSNPVTPEAEGVIYSLLVDTADFELILLRYAAVLQDPMHAPEDQPRFRLEVLDSNFALIDSACTSADFIADQALGWNMAEDNVLWKDWTAVGIDLSSYSGQQVYVRLSTFDCNEGSHYGYAYFTLECMRKSLETTACGAIDSNTFTAPAGFNYRWYTSQSTSTYSTGQSITVASADITYYCDMSKLDNAACHFTISAYGGTRYPMASFDTAITMSDCRFYVTFTNNSTVSADGVTPIAGEDCESAFWDFGNGQTATTYHASTVYSLPGVYTVMLISGIAGDACTDTAIITLNLTIPDGTLPMDTTYATICSNQTYLFHGDPYNTPGTYTYAVANDGTCDSLHLLFLTVNPTSGSDTTAVACDTFGWHGYTFANTQWGPRGYTQQALTGFGNAYGCDSTVTLHLTLYSHHDEAVVDTIVENQLPYAVADTVVTLADMPAMGTLSSTYTHTYLISTADGCDSTVDLSLTVWLNSTSVNIINICRNELPLIFNGDTILTDSSTLTRTYHTLTTHGADSTIVLQLTVTDNPTATFYDTIVENQLPHTFRGVTFNAPADTTLLLAGTGCDTLAAYHLHVWPNQWLRLQRDVCDDTLPYTWDGHTFAATDSVTFTLPDQHGADSTVHLVLIVHPTYSVADTHVICPSQGYVYEGVDYGGPAEFDAPHLSVHGCDSTVHVVLMPRDTSYHLHPLYSLGGQRWLPADTVFACAPDTLYLRDTTPEAVAWQWSISAYGSTSTSASDSISILLPDSTFSASYMVIINSDGGCIDTLAYPVYVFRTPTAAFDWNPSLPAIDQPYVTFHNTSTPLNSELRTPNSELSYLWHFATQPGAEPSDTSTAFEPYYRWAVDALAEAGDYDVQLIVYWLQYAPDTSIHHVCTDSVTHPVTITNDFLQFPNLVTPDGDGNNDTWRVVNLIEFGNYPQNELWIFNQWGVEVYHVRDISVEADFWDPNRTNSPDGTYYYRFAASGPYGVVKQNGIIEVLRK